MSWLAARGDPAGVETRHWRSALAIPGVVEAFLAAFDASHPASPAEKAAAILRESFREPPAFGRLAREVATSRTGLWRSFRRRFKMAMGEYLTRVRLRWFVEEIRKPGSNAERAAAAAGYASYHNVVGALRARTGLTPTQIRRLPPTRFGEILNDQLSLGSARASPEGARRAYRSAC